MINNRMRAVQPAFGETSTDPRHRVNIAMKIIGSPSKNRWKEPPSPRSVRYAVTVASDSLAEGEGMAATPCTNPPPIVEYWSETLRTPVRKGELWARKNAQ